MNVVLHLTQACQLRCVYCYSGRKSARTMSRRVAEGAVDMIFERPENGRTPRLTFFGGEPLLAFGRIRETVAHVEAWRALTGRECKLAITTNGLGLDEDVADYFRVHEIEPTLSFDGVPGAQDACRRYRDGRSSFADMVKAMRLTLRRF
ncbi:MAG: radical SAM protein, partial [Planctomycetota bacterium]